MNGTANNYDPNDPSCQHCDGGVDCYKRSRPGRHICAECLCHQCNKGKCRELARALVSPDRRAG